jgi:hypothetical protein
MKKIALVQALAACSILLSVAGASALTPEQQALVKKYKISAADQQKLFGPAATATAAAPVANAASPRKYVPTKAPELISNNPLTNTYVWIGGDAYKGLGDRITNINGGTGGLANSFGVVGGFNTSVGIGDTPVRFQVGASYGLYDFSGRLRIVPDAFDTERQSFFTAGIYKRGNMSTDTDRISWGVVYDVMQAQNWGVNASNINLSQARGIFGVALNQWTEVGVWGTLNVNHDRAAVTVAGAPAVRSTIRSMDQANLYVKQHFSFGGELMAYVGKLDDASIGDWQVGLRGQVPLSAHWAAHGNFNYVVPNAPSGPNGSGLEQWNVSFGLTYYFGGNAQSTSVTGPRGRPLLGVANNSSFLITD